MAESIVASSLCYLTIPEQQHVRCVNTLGSDVVLTFWQKKYKSNVDALKRAFDKWQAVRRQWPRRSNSWQRNVRACSDEIIVF